MPPASVNTQRRISSMIKKFKFSEFEDAVLPLFPELSWINIKSKLIKDHQHFTSSDAVKIIEHEINKCHLNDSELRKRLAELETVDISRHSKKKIWYGYELRDNENDKLLIPNIDMEKRIAQSFLINSLKTNVKIINNEGITFISLKQKEKTKQLLPIFVALYLHQGYFFISKKNIAKDVLNGIVAGLGYKSYKYLNLSGRNLSSLIKIIHMKKNGCVRYQNLYDTPIIKNSQPIYKKTGIDFRQHKERRKYLEKCFGSENLEFELLTMNSTEIPWIYDKLKNDKMIQSWEFKSRNVPLQLLQLTQQRIFINPLPEYITKLIENGKNKLTVTL